MEQPTTSEESVVSTEKRFDETDRPAPAVAAAEAGGPPPSASLRHSPESGFVAPEFETGKIAAMKRKLSDRGLDLSAKATAVPIASAGAVTGAGAGTVTSSTRSSGKELAPEQNDALESTSATSAPFQEQFDGHVTKAEATMGILESGQDERVRVAPGMGHCLSPTLEKGKIQSMKKELVAKGLAIDPEVAAALAAGGLIHGKNVTDAGLAEAIAAEFEQGKIAAMKERLMSEGLDINAAAAAVAAAMAANTSGTKSMNGDDESWHKAAAGVAAQGVDSAVDTRAVKEEDVSTAFTEALPETVTDSSTCRQEEDGVVEVTSTKQLDAILDVLLDEKVETERVSGTKNVDEIIDTAAEGANDDGPSPVDIPPEDVPSVPDKVPSIPAESSAVATEDLVTAAEGPHEPAEGSSVSAEGPSEIVEGPSVPSECPPETSEGSSISAGSPVAPSEEEGVSVPAAAGIEPQSKMADDENPPGASNEEHVPGQPPTSMGSGEGESTENGRAVAEREDPGKGTISGEPAVARGEVPAGGALNAPDVAPDATKSTTKVTFSGEGKRVGAKDARVRQQAKESSSGRRSATPDRKPERRLSSSSRRDSPSSSQRRTLTTEKETFVAVRSRPGGKTPSTSPGVGRVAGTPQQSRYVSPQAQQPRVAASLAAARGRRRMESPSAAARRSGGRQSDSTAMMPLAADSSSTSSAPSDKRTTPFVGKVDRVNPLLPGAVKGGSPAVAAGRVGPATAATPPAPTSRSANSTPSDRHSALGTGRAHRANPPLPEASSAQSPAAAAGEGKSAPTEVQGSQSDAAVVTPSAPPPRSARSTPSDQRATPGSGRAPRASSLLHGTANVVSPTAIPVVRRGRSPENHQQFRRSPVIRNQGSSPGASPGQGSMVTPVRTVHVAGGSPGTVVVTPSSAERAGERLHNQARETRERLERRRREGASPVAVEGLSPFTPRRLANPRLGNPSVSGMERVERLYRDATRRESKLMTARKMEEENPRDCTFAPKISARASSRGRSQSRGRSPGGDGEGGSTRDRSLSCFQALYEDAELRRAKIEERTNARVAEVAGPGSPIITARGRARSRDPLDVRLRENTERWARHRDQLEEKRLVQEREGCTFKPEFKTTRSASAPRTRTGSRDIESDGLDASPVEPFYRRAERYLAAREQKLEQLKRDIEAREQAEATFQPNVSPGLLEGEEGERGSSVERSRRRKSNKGDGSAGSGDVFERLLKAATEQELHKAALKEAYLKQEREEFHDFQPRLPAKLADSGPSVPLETRLQESTAQWVQSREDRERRRIEMEAEKCTFRPSIGFSSNAGSDVESAGSVGSSGRRPRRSASADSRIRSRASLGAGNADGASFEARSKAFQEAREKRLSRLREEKKRQELSEATFHPSIGFGNNPQPLNGTSLNGTSDGRGGRVPGGDAVAVAADDAPVCDPSHGAGGNAQDMGKAPVKEKKKEQLTESRRARRPKPAAPAPVAPVIEPSLSKAAQKKEGRFKTASGRDGFKAQASRRSAVPSSVAQSAGAGAREDEDVRQELPNDGNSAGRSGQASEDLVLPGAQMSLSPLLPPAPPASREQLAQPDHKTAVIAKAGSATFKGESTNVENLQQALQQARRKRERQQAADAAGASATEQPVLVSDAPSDVTGSTRIATLEMKEVSDAGETVDPLQGIRRSSGQGVDVNELSARLELLAADSAATVPEDSIRSNGEKKAFMEPTVNLPSAPEMHSEGGGALPVLPHLDQGIAAPLSVTQPASGEDDEDEAQLELGAMIAKHRKRAIDVDGTLRSSPGAEDSEAESAADVEVDGREHKSVDAVRVDENENVGQPKEGHTGGTKGEAKGGMYEEDDEDDDDDDDDDDEAFRYASNNFHAEPKVDQPSRSLADFDRCQREIEAKLRAL